LTNQSKTAETTRTRYAIVVAKWNSFVTDGLLQGAVRTLEAQGLDSQVFQVPGAFELPLVCQEAAKSEAFEAVIALGAVIRGDTPHFDYVCSGVTHGITQASLSTSVPIAFGVLTTDTVEDAVARSRDDANNKGSEAAMAAIDMVEVLQTVPN
jgi:6,7-dimethyl-8-ribityllumazine synthase